MNEDHNIKLKEIFFGWKVYVQNQRKKITDNIKAQNFYFIKMFKRCLASFIKYQKIYYQQIVFNRFKKGMMVMLKDSIQLREILIIIRKRQFLNIMLSKYRYRKNLKNKQQYIILKKQKYLLQKYLRELKINTILQKIINQRNQRHVHNSKIMFIANLTKCSNQLKQYKINESKGQTFYRKRILNKYFEAFKEMKSLNKIAIIINQKKKSVFKFMTKIINSETNNNKAKADKYKKRNILKKYFQLLFFYKINSKANKFRENKLFTTSFKQWIKFIEAIKVEKNNIPIQFIHKIEIKIKYTLKLKYFRIIQGQFVRRTSEKKQKYLSEQYYKLKSQQVLYKKYFNKLYQNMNNQKCERFHKKHLLIKGMDSFRRYYISQNKIKIAVTNFIEKREKIMKNNIFNQFCKYLIKNSRSFKYYANIIMKKYFQKWLQQIVQQYLNGLSKACKYYETNLKFKVIYALQQQKMKNKLLIDILKIRVRSFLKGWKSNHKIKTFKREKQYKLKAVAFRKWKFLRYALKN